MSRLSLALALLFALPASSQARHPHPRASEGCRVVADGRGSVTVAARGGIFGRFDMGQVIVDELRPSAANNPQVSGAQEVQTLGQTTTKYVGDNVREDCARRARVRRHCTLKGRASSRLKKLSESGGARRSWHRPQYERTP
jgi:hypothetical protein